MGKYFSKPNPYHVAKFWRKKWGCEPLSQFLRDRINGTGDTVDDGMRIELEPMAARCQWTIAYDVWYSPKDGSEYGHHDACLGNCCHDPQCMGILMHSTLDSQCYKFTELPDEIKREQATEEKL